AGNSICGKAATKSPRKVLKSPPWARHLIELKRVRRIALRLDPLLPKQVPSYLSYPPTRNNRGILKHVQSLPPRHQHRLSVHSVQQWLESHKLLPSSVSQRSLHIKVDENKQIAHRRMVAGPGIRGIIAK